MLFIRLLMGDLILRLMMDIRAQQESSSPKPSSPRQVAPCVVQLGSTAYENHSFTDICYISMGTAGGRPAETQKLWHLQTFDLNI